MFQPSDFRIPFPKTAPQIAILDHVFYIPPTCDRNQFSFPGWYNDTIFGSHKKPIAIEFCSGNGSWILEKAQKKPDVNWVAVEKRFDRVRKIWVKMKNMNLDNVFIVFGEALSFSVSYIPTDSIDTLYINFPDPWPKTRHAKNRIISPLLFSETSRILKTHGRFIFVTDDASYSTWFLDQYEMWNKGCFSLAQGQEEVLNPPEDYGSSFFEDLFRRQGRTIKYHERIRTEQAYYTAPYYTPTSGVLSMNSYTYTRSSSK